MILFKSIDNFQPGLIETITKASYQKLISCFPGERQRFFSQWEKEDRDAFGNPAIMGRYVIFTCSDHIPVGYISWDDRQYPLGIVGQNCILPEYQGQGYGRMQMEKIIRIFLDNNFKEIIAITGDHEFFLPARRMYLRCGFIEQARKKGTLFDLIKFRRLI